MRHRTLFAVFAAVLLLIHLSPTWADDKVTLKSKDGQTQIVLPAGWVGQDSTNSSAVLEGHNEDANAFVMVVIADRSDPYATVGEYASDRRNEVLSHLVKSKCSEPREFQWNDYKAVQYEIHGIFAASKIPFGYYLTVVQVGRHYLEVVSWAMEKHFEENAQTLRDAVSNVTYKGDQ
ncbi:MAG TPA: hypothetical protein VHX86_03980 [Tepidisphaeraceae bacterium]|jgi:hypothetical protein|nr:hypothetical protein [Tepidisphaeraceae bacterium]